MGSKKTYVGTSVSRLIADEQVTSAIKKGALTSSLNNKDILEEITDALVHSIATSGNAYYNYGKNKYALPLPTGQASTAFNTHGSTQVEEVIQSEVEMAEVVMDYCFFGNLNYFHILMEYITNTYGYDITTNKLDTLTILKGYPVSLSQLTLIGPTALIDAMSDDSLLVLDGNCYVRINELVSTIGAEIKYTWSVPPVHPEVVPTVYVETLSLGTDVTPVWFDVAADYYHARYVIGGSTKYFTYEKDIGTYPLLDNLFDLPSAELGSYFPWVHLRHNYTAIDADPGTEECISATALMRRLGIDLSMISSSISENPDIGYVIQAILMMGVPPESTNPVDQEYLYRYFDAMFNDLGGEITSLSAVDLVASFTPTDLVKKTNVIQDSKLLTNLSNLGIYRRLVTGVLGKVNTYHSTSSGFNIAIPRYNEDGGGVLYFLRYVSYMLYQKQVSATQYEEIQVVDLSCQYHVLGRYYTTGDTNDETNIILVPLDMSVVAKISLVKRETLYARSAHIVFNSVQVVKLEWYQEAWFTIVLFIVAIAIIVFSEGTMFKEALALLTGGFSIPALIIFLLDVAGVAFYTYAFKEIVKAIGIEDAIIIVLILSLKNLYTLFNAASIESGLVSAEYLLKLASGLLQGIQTMTTELTKDIMGEMDALNKEMESAFGELDKIRKEMEQSTVLNPMMLLGETPDEYYNRTVHSGNIGVKVYETVSKYVKTMLTLPEFDGFFESKEHGTT